MKAERAAIVTGASSGIGLAMTYRILQMHYGSVEVQSVTGQGSDFRLRIPLAPIDWGRRHLRAVSSVNHEESGE